MWQSQTEILYKEQKESQELNKMVSQLSLNESESNNKELDNVSKSYSFNENKGSNRKEHKESKNINIDKMKLYSSDSIEENTDNKPPKRNSKTSIKLGKEKTEKDNIYPPQSAYYTNLCYKKDEQNHSDFEVSSVSSTENNRKDKFKPNWKVKKYPSSSNSLKENLANLKPSPAEVILPKLDHIIEAYVKNRT